MCIRLLLGLELGWCLVSIGPMLLPTLTIEPHRYLLGGILNGSLLDRHGPTKNQIGGFEDVGEKGQSIKKIFEGKTLFS